MAKVDYFFFDTSALVKKYKVEAGFEQVKYWFEEYKKRRGKKLRFFISLISIAEYLRMLYYKVYVEERPPYKIPIRDLKYYLAQFLHDWTVEKIFEVYNFKIKDAEASYNLLKLAKEVYAKPTKEGFASSQDVLVVASALRFEQEYRTKRLYFITSDMQQFKIAKRVGLKVMNPAWADTVLKEFHKP